MREKTTAEILSYWRDHAVRTDAELQRLKHAAKLFLVALEAPEAVRSRRSRALDMDKR